MVLGQTLLDSALAFEQPVHGGVELVFVNGLDAEHLGQGVACGVGGQSPRGGQLRAWGEDTGDNQGNGALARSGEAVAARVRSRRGLRRVPSRAAT